MSFGQISVPASGSVILGTDGSRVGTGGVLLLGAGGAAGSFSASTGNRDCTTFPLVTVAVTAPATLAHTTQPASTMSVNNFQVNPGAGILFSSTTTFSVGATLSATVGQLPGTYQGTYLLTVTFQ